MTTPPRKRGRPKLDRPPKLSRRPFKIADGTPVQVVFPPDGLARLDKIANAAGLTRSAMIRKLVDDAPA